MKKSISFGIVLMGLMFGLLMTQGVSKAHAALLPLNLDEVMEDHVGELLSIGSLLEHNNDFKLLDLTVDVNLDALRPAVEPGIDSLLDLKLNVWSSSDKGNAEKGNLLDVDLDVLSHKGRESQGTESLLDVNLDVLSPGKVSKDTDSILDVDRNVLSPGKGGKGSGSLVDLDVNAGLDNVLPNVLGLIPGLGSTVDKVLDAVDTALPISTSNLLDAVDHVIGGVAISVCLDPLLTLQLQTTGGQCSDSSAANLGNGNGNPGGGGNSGEGGNPGGIGNPVGGGNADGGVNLGEGANPGGIGNPDDNTNNSNTGNNAIGGDKSSTDNTSNVKDQTDSGAVGNNANGNGEGSGTTGVNDSDQVTENSTSIVSKPEKNSWRGSGSDKRGLAVLPKTGGLLNSSLLLVGAILLMGAGLFVRRRA